VYVYKTQGTPGDGKLTCLFLNSLGQVGEGAPFPRGLCNPPALLLWANSSLLLSTTGAESLLPVNAPSVSVSSHNDTPPDSLQTLSLEESSPEPAQGICLDSHLQDHGTQQRVWSRNVPPHE